MTTPVVKWIRTGALLMVAAVAFAGCATGPYADPRDPLEELNRSTYSFNRMVDRMFWTPAAEAYQIITPDPVDRGITNFFNNLSDVRSALNNILQFKVTRAINDLGRFAVNSTVGILGFIDVASNLDMQRYNEDFGQTLGVWGFDSGPYLVLPIIGPSSVRDGVGLVGDIFASPVYWATDDSTVMWTLWGIQAVDTRADLLAASRVVEQAALDPYTFIRDAYLQRREALVFDGAPPDPSAQP